jgi:hypothetical protein
MGKKTAGVNTCIRSAAAQGFQFSLKDTGKSMIQNFLNGNPIGLDLPTMICCAMVSQFDEISVRLRQERQR